MDTDTSSPVNQAAVFFVFWQCEAKNQKRGPLPLFIRLSIHRNDRLVCSSHGRRLLRFRFCDFAPVLLPFLFFRPGRRRNGSQEEQRRRRRHQGISDPGGVVILRRGIVCQGEGGVVGTKGRTDRLHNCHHLDRHAHAAHL